MRIYVEMETSYNINKNNDFTKFFVMTQYAEDFNYNSQFYNLTTRTTEKI